MGWEDSRRTNVASGTNGQEKVGNGQQDCDIEEYPKVANKGMFPRMGFALFPHAHMHPERPCLHAAKSLEKKKKNKWSILRNPCHSPKCLVMSPHQPRLQEQPMQLPRPSPALPCLLIHLPAYLTTLTTRSAYINHRINTPSQQNVRTHHLPFLMQLLRFHAATRIGVAGIQPMRGL